MTATSVSKKFRREVENASQDRLRGPIVDHYRKAFSSLLHEEGQDGFLRPEGGGGK